MDREQIIAGIRRLNRNQKITRRKSARAKIHFVIRRCGRNCRWCGRELTPRFELPPEHQKTPCYRIQIERDGPWLLLMTIDHVIPISAGGDSRLSNLVPACGPCNNHRTATKSPKSQAERLTCPKCGGEKRPKRRKCGQCRMGDRPLIDTGQLRHSL